MSKNASIRTKPHRRKDDSQKRNSADPWSFGTSYTPAYVPIRSDEFRRSDPHYLSDRRNEPDPKEFQQSVFLKALMFLTALALLLFALAVVVNWLMPSAPLDLSATSSVYALTSGLSDV